MQKRHSNKIAYTVCLVIAMLFFVLFTARLADWQLIHGQEYREMAQRSTSYTVTTDATRGEILDRSGKGLVVNNTCYRIVIDKLYADAKSLDDTLLSLMELLKRTGEGWEDLLPIVRTADGFAFDAAREEETEILLSDDYLGKQTAPDPQACLAQLCERYRIGDGYSADALRDLAAVHYTMERRGYSNDNPFVFASDVSRSTVSAVSENTQGVSGVDVQTYLERGAQDGTLAPHLLGALGALSEEEYTALANSEKPYALNDRIGKFGIEAAFEQQLKGVAGTKIISRNADGSIVDTAETIDAQPGNTVWLTLDSKLQKTAVRSLEKNVRAAQAEGAREAASSGKSMVGEDCATGAAVMLSVRDFSVLAAASYPTYDLNRYSSDGDYYETLATDTRAPMYDRAFQGIFAWGSAFKPCVAMAALQEGAVSADTTIYCKQYYDYYPTNPVACMHYHGDLDLTGALTRSCNYYFAEAGRRLGIESMYLYAEQFGLGEYTGLEVEESRGVLAGRDSDSWQAGNTVQAAIGQSDNAFTPVQMATYAATIANNGTRLKTHAVRQLTNYERTRVLADYGSPETVQVCGVSPENLQTVQNAMLSVTQDSEGTANYMFGDYKVKVAAKTGTAENAGSDHTTFICYAPFDKPEVAVAVVLEHGVRGTYSMQVARDLLDSYFGK